MTCPIIRACPGDWSPGLGRVRDASVSSGGAKRVPVWPWAHLAFGYLAYAGYTWARYRRAPAGWPVLAMAVATQFPDIVDKPLAYWFTLLPEGRSLTHSLVVVVPLWVLLLWYTRRRRSGELGVAFVIGHATHLLGDSYGALLDGRVAFLLWPIVPAPDYPASDFAHHARKLADALRQLDVGRLILGWDDPFVVQLWLAVFVVGLWVSQGAPPLGTLERLVRGRRS